MVLDMDSSIFPSVEEITVFLDTVEKLDKFESTLKILSVVKVIDFLNHLKVDQLKSGELNTYI